MCVSLMSKTTVVAPIGSFRSSGTMHSMRNLPPGSRWAAAFRKHRDLAGLRRDVLDGVEDEVDQGEASRRPHGCHVADLDGNGLAARLRLEPPEHGSRELDARDVNAERPQGHRHAPCPDRQLERPLAAGEVRQHLDGVLHGGAIDHGFREVVVVLRDVLVEVAVLAHEPRAPLRMGTG